MPFTDHISNNKDNNSNIDNYNKQLSLFTLFSYNYSYYINTSNFERLCIDIVSVRINSGYIFFISNNHNYSLALYIIYVCLHI